MQPMARYQIVTYAKILHIASAQAVHDQCTWHEAHCGTDLISGALAQESGTFEVLQAIILKLGGHRIALVWYSIGFLKQALLSLHLAALQTVLRA